MKKLILSTALGIALFSMLGFNARAEGVNLTRSSLKLTYDDASGIATDVDLRFGGIIPEASFDETAEYGVIVVAGAEANRLNSLTIDSLNQLKSERKVITGMPKPVDGGYQLSWVINNMEGHYKNELTGAMYSIKDNNLLVYEAKTESVLSVCDKYLALPDSELSTNIKNVVKNVKANNNNLINGGFETGSLAGWEALSNNINVNDAVIKDSTFWGEKISYNQGGAYHFDGWKACPAEPEGYSLKSNVFTLGGSGDISFKLGGKAAVLEVYLANNNEKIAEFRNNLFADVNFPLLEKGCRLATMNSYYYSLADYVGKDIYVVIKDDSSISGWAIAMFDDICFSYNEKVDFTTKFDEVQESNNGKMLKLPYTKATNLILKNNVKNGGFEDGNLNGWELVAGTINTNTAVSADLTFWGENISYNQDGSYHFDGWKATGVEPDGYAIRSNTFVLSGSGYASFKMGGNAAHVKVYLKDGSLIADYKNEKFADPAGSFPFLEKGSRLATMTRYFADLSKYVGKEIYVELVDDANTQGWAIAMFDAINFYYENKPEVNGFDLVNESKNEQKQVQIKWEIANNLLK